MTTYSYHKCLRIYDFTAFSSAVCNFVPGINVFVGENGSGKTHLLKVLYATQLAYHRKEAIEPHLQRIFQIAHPDEVVSSWVPDGTFAVAEGIWGDQEWQFSLKKGDHHYFLSDRSEDLATTRPVFIPAIDMLGHTRRFISTYNEYQIDFDQTHRDIVSLILSPEKRDADDDDPMLKTLSTMIGARVQEENERLYFVTSHGRIAAPLVAEGIRKVATLYMLIRNGWLNPGSVLFWDEPEVNVNPILMREVVKILLDLASSGVQIFLATHSYVVLKELDLQATPRTIRYFALDRANEAVIVSAHDDYAMMEPNRIADAFDSLYDRVLTKSTGRPRTSASSH